MNGLGTPLNLNNFYDGQWDEGHFKEGKQLTNYGTFYTGKYKEDKLVEGRLNVNDTDINLNIHVTNSNCRSGFISDTYLRIKSLALALQGPSIFSQKTPDNSAELTFKIKPTKVFVNKSSQCLVSGPITYNGYFNLDEGGPSGTGLAIIPGISDCFNALGLDPKEFLDDVLFCNTTSSISGTWKNGCLLLKKTGNKKGILIKIAVNLSSFYSDRKILYIGEYEDKSISDSDSPWFEESPSGGVKWWNHL